jgi:hypothetical protein
MYVSGSAGDAFYQYALSTAYDVSTAVYQKTYAASDYSTTVNDFTFAANGTKIYLADDVNDSIIEFELPNAYDIGSMRFVSRRSISVQEAGVQGVALNADESKMYIIGSTSDSVHQYSLVNTGGANRNYSNNVTIIGQDNASGLTQSKSKSQEKYGVLTVGTPSALGDGDFLAIGDNGQQAATFVSAGTADTLSVPAGYQRLDRVWKTQVTATPGTVKIELDTNDSDLDLPNITGSDGKLYLLLDATATGNGFADETPILMYDDGTNGDSVASDNIWTRQTVTFVTAQAFTFAQLTPPGPGGVTTGLNFWVKAGESVYSDAGLTAVTNGGAIQQWNDVSGSSNNMIQTTLANKPLFASSTSTNAINFQPSVVLDGTDDYLALSGTNTLFTNVAPGRVFAVGTRSNLIGTWNTLFQQGTANGNNPMFGIHDDSPYWYDTGCTAPCKTNTLSTTQVNTPFLLGFNWNTPAAGQTFTGSINGVNETSSTTFNNSFAVGPTAIAEPTASEGWYGNLAEVITFQATPSATEVRRVQSYLGLKYGLTVLQTGDVQNLDNANMTISADQGQTITAPLTGYINDITLMTGATTANGTTATLSICTGATFASTCAASPTYTQTVTNIPTAVSTVFHISLKTAFPVTSASAYTFVLTTTSGTNINLRAQSTNVYAGGTGTFAGSNYAGDLYFAYSMTPQDYLASDGTTKMWDATVAGLYNQGVAGFGKDAGSGLLTTKSKQQSINGLVTLEATVPADLADLEFATISNKNGGFTTGWTSTAAPSGYQRIGTTVAQREWLYQENGDGVTTLNLTVDTTDLDANISEVTGKDGNLYLLYDQNADNDLADAGDLLQMYDDGTNGDILADDGIYNVQVDLATGTEFTFAQMAPATPGNVSGNLRAWYRADAGIARDQSGLISESPVAGVSDWDTGTGPTTQFGQSFTAEATGTFSSFAFNPNGAQGSNMTATIYICNGDVDYATCSGAPTYTQAGITVVAEDGLAGSTQWNTVRFTTPYSVVKGSQYTVHINLTSGSVNSGLLYWNETNTYKGGRAYGISPTMSAADDLTFQVGSYFARYVKDLSGNQIDMYNTTSTTVPAVSMGTTIAPGVSGIGYNYNPVFSFDGGDRLQDLDGDGPLGLIPNGESFGADNLDTYAYIVYQNDVNPSSAVFDQKMAGSKQYTYYASGANSKEALYSGNTTISDTAGSGAMSVNFFDSGYVLQRPYLTTTVTQTTNTTGKFIRKNGKVMNSNSGDQLGRTVNDTTAITGTSDDFEIGAVEGGSLLQGKIAEMIFYVGNNSGQSDLEQTKIQTYLALKYGITLSNTDPSGNGTASSTDNDLFAGGFGEGDYILSDGTTSVWNGHADGDDTGDSAGAEHATSIGGVATSFHNDVAGIGRDDNGGLNRKIARSISDDNIVTMALQNNFVAENNASTRTTQASDMGWLMWGNDNGSKFFDTPITHSTVNLRLGKTFKTKTTGTISNPYVRIGGGFARAIDLIPGQSYMLLTDADGVFDASSTVAATATPTYMTTGDTTTMYLDFGQIDFSTNAYFTVATYQQAPGGVVADYIPGLRVEVYNEFPSGNTSATDSEQWMGKDSPYSVPHLMYYVNDFVNVDDAEYAMGLVNEEASMEMYGEIFFADTTQKVFNYTGTTNDMFSLYIDEQPIIIGTATANSEGVYTPATTGWKKIRVKWSNRGGDGNINLTYLNNASTCGGGCANIPTSMLRVSAPMSAWYKPGVGQYTSAAGTTPMTTDNTLVFRWDSVSPLINQAIRVDGGNTYRNNTTDNINGNPVINNNVDKFRVNTGTLEARTAYSWGLPLKNTARTLYSAATSTSSTNSNHLLQFGDDGTATARYLYSLYSSAGEIAVIDHQVNYGEVSPGTIESQVANTPYVIGASYSGGSTSSTTTNINSLWGNGMRTLSRTPSIDMLTNNQTSLMLNGNVYDTADWSGKVGEQIVYPWELTGAQRQRVDSYLATKFGTTYTGGEKQVNHDGTNAAILTVGQTFTASVTGDLTNLTLRTGGTANSATGTLYICAGAVSIATCTSSPTYQQPLTTIPTALNTTFTLPITTAFPVTAGSVYTFVLGAGTNVFLRTISTDQYLAGSRVGFGTTDLFFIADIKPNLLTSAGTTIWTEEAYHNYVTAIGRDDGSALSQLSSLSTSANTVGSGGLVRITKNSVFTASGDFLVIGDNAGAYSTWTSSVAIPAGYVRPGVTASTPIEWRARETGTDNVYDVTVNLGNTTRDLPGVSALNGILYMLYDSDGDADLTDEIVGTGILAMNDSGLLGDAVAADGVWTAQSVDLDDGDEFTFIQEAAKVPGAVTNGLRFWLNANSMYDDLARTDRAINGDAINGITDLSGNGIYSGANGGQLYRDASSTIGQAFNSNPVADWNATSNLWYFKNADGTDIMPFNLTGTSPFTIVSVQSTTTDSGGIIGNGSNTAGSLLYKTESEKIEINSYGTNLARGTTRVTHGMPQLTSASRGTTGVNDFVIRVNGQTEATATNAASLTSTANHTAIGYGGNYNTTLKLPELMVYNAALTDAEQQRVESYMAMKYGLTLMNRDYVTGINDGDYVLSDGTTVVWNGTFGTGSDLVPQMTTNTAPSGTAFATSIWSGNEEYRAFNNNF